MKSVDIFFIILAFVMSSLKASSQEFTKEIGIISDNDAYLWYGQDRYYTNGIFVYYREAVNQEKLNNKLEKLTYELALGQKMFTPGSGYGPDPKSHNRPFAGYLYGKFQVNLFTPKEAIWKIGLSAGTAGPHALAKESQSLAHKTIGLYEVSGWDYQIKSEPTINFNFHYAKLLHRSRNKSVDLSTETYANVGTFFNGAGLSVALRLGHINQLFNSSYYNASISKNAKKHRLQANEFYFYLTPQLHYVIYDATIQGSIFAKKSPVTFAIRPLVFEQKVGINYSTTRFSMDYSLTFRTKEIKSSATSHQYGTISLYYHFN